MANTKKKPRRSMHRNRASPRTLALATVPAAGPPATAGKPAGPQDETNGWRAIKAAGGALAITIAGAMAARQDWIPPKILTGALTGIGAAVAVGAPSATARSIGLGVMASAGGQFGLMMIDDELIKLESKSTQLALNRPAPSAGGKKPANAGEIPPDALARAYERARLRMAMSSDMPH
jgi:hypothetical protein